MASSKNSIPILKNHGFSLIELLVVVTILSITAVVALVFYYNLQKNARDAKRKMDLDNISKALETRFNTQADQNCPAPSFSYCKVSIQWFLPAMIPVDPSTGAFYGGVKEIKNGDKTYAIFANLEDGTTITRSSRQ